MTKVKVYGEVFKSLRKQKGFKLTSFVHIGVSPATLCKFENGKTMIKFDKLVLALKELSITLTEYEKCINNFELPFQEKLIRDTILAHHSLDTDKLKQSYTKFLKIQERPCALAVKKIYENLSQEELDHVVDYFENLSYWRYIDLYTLYLMTEHLKPRQLSYFLEGFFVNDDFCSTLNSLEHRIRFIQIVCKSVICLAYHGHKQLTNHFLEYINPDIFLHTMYTKNLYNFAKGYWQATFENKKSGKEQMKSALIRFEELSAPSVPHYYESISKKYKSF